MNFTIDLEYTLRCPQTGKPFTEESFVRKSRRFTFDVSEMGVALVDLWNFGFEDGPVGETLGPELSLERGVSHAQRKRRIIENVIVPTVNELRKRGVQIFHCNHANVLERYPQWSTSTTEAERESLKPKNVPPPNPDGSTSDEKDVHPPREWVKAWRERHRDLVFNTEWEMKQGKEIVGRFGMPAIVKPHDGDLLVSSGEQFHRLLTERRIRVLFYMGFETDECVVTGKPYSIYRMFMYGYLCVIVRDGTTTYETAETLNGLWKTKVAIDSIEARWGYSITSKALLKAIRSAR